MRRVAMGSAMLAVMVGMSAPATAGSARIRHADAASVRCSSSGLSVWLYTPPGNGALGSRYFYIEFTNLSGHTCTLHGAPGVSAVSLSGRQIGAAAARNLQHLPAQVLANGATAAALLKITVAAAIGGCHPHFAAGLRVYPPNQVASRVVPFPVKACSQTFMSVGEVEANHEGIEYP